MPEETTITTPPETATPPPDTTDWKAKYEAESRAKADLLSEVKKLKGASRAADDVAKTAEQLARELRDERAHNEVLAAFNAEGIKLPSDRRKSYIAAVLNSPEVEVSDSGVKGVGDALKALREAGLFGGIPATAKPEASPVMAKPAANAAPIDPKYANVNTRRDLIALGAAAFNEFTAKYPERYAALR